MMASIVNYLLLALLMLISNLAVAFPANGLQYDFGLTELEIYVVDVASAIPLYVPNNGTLFNTNPSGGAIQRVCIDMQVPGCAFGAEDGTWIAASNGTNNGCVDISPPLVLNNGFCCISLDDCALLNQPFLLGREESYSHRQVDDISLVLLSGGLPPQYMTVPNDGTPFDFVGDLGYVSQVCINASHYSACKYIAFDGTTTYGDTYRGINHLGLSCQDVDPARPLDHGVCCQDYSADFCPPFKPRQIASLIEEGPRDIKVRDELITGPVRHKKIIHILFEGAPDLVGWVFTEPNMQGFNVSGRVPWAVGQVCTQDDTVLCAFIGTNGLVVPVIGGWGSNCNVVAPPQVITGGVCCESPAQCNASDHQFLNKLVGDDVMYTYILDQENMEKAAQHDDRSLSPRAANVQPDVTLQYWGAADAYTFQLVPGDNSAFYPLAKFGVDRVCMIAPQGLCGFWSADFSLGFQLGPVVPGDAGACYTVPAAYVLAGGICCLNADGCVTSRLIKSLSRREADAVAVGTPTRRVSLFGDPHIAVASGETISVDVVGNGRLQKLPWQGSPSVKFCVGGGWCQFFVGNEFTLGPSWFNNNGGCMSIPSTNLTGVACD